MNRNKHKSEQIIHRLKTAEHPNSRVKTVTEVCLALSRWYSRNTPRRRPAYGVMQVEAAKQVGQLEKSYSVSMQFSDVHLRIVECLHLPYLTKKPPAEARGKASLKETGS